MPRRFAILLTLALGLLGARAASAVLASPDPDPSERGFPLIQAYLPDAPGAGLQIFGVDGDPRGFLVAANTAGALVYDGSSWRNVPIGKAIAAWGVASDSRGGIGVGGDDDFGYLEPSELGDLRFVSLVDRLPASRRQTGQVFRVHPVPEGFVYLATNGIYLWDGRELSTIAEISPERPLAKSFLVDGEVYAWTKAGLFRRSGKALVSVPGGDAYANRRVDLILPDEGGLLVSVREEGLFRLRDGRSEPFGAEASRWARAGRVQDGLRLPDGRWALSSFLGGVCLVRPDGEVDQVIDTSVGLPDNAAYGLAVDHEGALWAALNNGLARIEVSSPLSSIDRRMGLEGTVYALARHRGHLWVGTAAGLFTNAPGGGARPGTGGPAGTLERTPFHLVPGIVTSIWSLLSTDDALIAGNAFGLYVLREGEAPRLIPESDGKTVFALARSRRDPDRIWVGLERTLASLVRRNGAWQWEKGSEVSFPSDIRHLHESARENLWVATGSHGLFGVDRLATWPRERVEPRSVPASQGGPIIPLDGCLAVLVDSGPRCIDEERYALAEDERLRELGTLADVGLLAQDAEGNLWLAHEPPGVALREGRGWSRSLKSFIGIKARSVEVIVPEPASRGGVVWLGTELGLIRHAGSVRAGTPPLSAPRLSEVSTDRGQVLLRAFSTRGAREVELAAGSRNLRIEIGPLSFRPGLRYQNRLEPVDEAWSAPGVEPYLLFPRLPPGKYTLHLRTVDPSAGPGPETAWSFRVAPPWYRSPWGLALWLGLAVLAVAGYVRLRHRALRQRAERLEARVAEQTDELRRSVEELRQAQAELEGANARLEELSLQDELTGIANRRRLQQVLEAEWSRARRHHLSVAFCLLDLDHFKLLNDTRGHLEGDHCLRVVAAFLSAAARRAGDLVSRYGGEEFAILLPNTDLEGALHLAEQLRQGVEDLALAHEAVPGGRVTASFGVAALIPGPEQRPEALLEAADHALYRAKSAGRNRAFASEDALPGATSTEVH